jgi:hypothetical protein
MSAGDYISLKKTKLLQNYRVNTISTVNFPQVSYENYVNNLNLRAVKCSTATYGNGVAKPLTINNIPIGRTTTCPANSYEGPIVHPVINADTPLQSTPSMPIKFQMPASVAASLSIPAKYKVVCYKGQHLCMQPASASIYTDASSKPYHRQWNVKKSTELRVKDSTTFLL